MRRTMLLALAFLGTAVARGDVITLKDGTRLEGELRRTADGWEITTADGKKTTIPILKVGGVELTKPAAKPGTAVDGGAGGASLEKLDSLRRSVAFSEDIPQIISRYKRFIEQNKATPLEAPAKKDLALWQDRLDRQLVKAGGNWVTREQYRAVVIAGLRAADEARQLIDSGRVNEASALLTRTLEADSGNVSAQYLMAVLQLRGGQFPVARKGFETVIASAAAHAPSLNNLAVVLLRQKQWGGALVAFDQALAAAPVNRLLLDNVAEATQIIPEDQQKSAPAQRLGKRFAEQDAELQRVLKAKGLFRWGATWVDQTTRDQLAEAEKKIRVRLDALQDDFKFTTSRISELSETVRANERAMNDIESHSYVRTGDGTLIRTPFPQVYYDMQRQSVQLDGEISTARRRLEALRAEARKVEAEFPVPKFTGEIRPIGPEGVPFVLPEGVTIQDVFPPAQPTGETGTTRPAGASSNPNGGLPSGPPTSPPPLGPFPPAPFEDDASDPDGVPPLLARPHGPATRPAFSPPVPPATAPTSPSMRP